MAFRSFTEPLSVAVLAGGESAERDVSLESGPNVAAALAEAGHQVSLMDPAHTPLADIAWQHYDLAFLALHGGAGEDGRVQRRLELLKVPYTGSGPSAAHLAMSKSASKERFSQHSVPTPPYVLFHRGEAPASLAPRLASLPLPLAIKPDGGGSSLGVTRVDRWEDLPAAIAAAGRLDAYLVAEPWIAGREFTVSLIDREPLPLLEIATPRKFFDYQAKYLADTTEYRFDHGLPAVLAEELQLLAAAAAECLGTRGLCRVDLLLDEQSRPWVLEVNTIPGMTSHSLAPLAAQQAGLTMSQLCCRLAHAAVASREYRRRAA